MSISPSTAEHKRKGDAEADLDASVGLPFLLRSDDTYLALMCGYDGSLESLLCTTSFVLREQLESEQAISEKATDPYSFSFHE